MGSPTSTSPAATPGTLMGTMTRRNTSNLPAPRSRAASSKLVSMRSRAAYRGTIMRGTRSSTSPSTTPAGRPAQAGVDAVQGRVRGRDHVGHVAVDEPQHHRGGSPGEPRDLYVENAA